LVLKLSSIWVLATGQLNCDFKTIGEQVAGKKNKAGYFQGQTRLVVSKGKFQSVSG
jgi:hypothetical protein